MKRKKTRKKGVANNLLILGIVLLVLIGSTACRTSKAVPEDENMKMVRKIIASELPEAPTLPSVPSLTWTFKDGLYGLNEADVDLLLDYFENSLREFSLDYEAWQKEVSVVIGNLT